MTRDRPIYEQINLTNNPTIMDQVKDLKKNQSILAPLIFCLSEQLFSKIYFKRRWVNNILFTLTS